MAFQSFGPLSNAPDPVRTTADDAARRIFRDDVIPSITNVANRMRRREDLAARGPDPVAGEAATKMLGIWDEVYELLHRRVGEEFPEVLQGGAPSVRDAWRW
jgi:hypothetical protein